MSSITFDDVARLGCAFLAFNKNVAWMPSTSAMISGGFALGFRINSVQSTPYYVQSNKLPHG
jgi:hypothetical protein